MFLSVASAVDVHEGFHLSSLSLDTHRVAGSAAEGHASTQTLRPVTSVVAPNQSNWSRRYDFLAPLKSG